MSVEANNSIGRLFFAEQDRLKAGPAEELCAPDYTARIGSFPSLDRAGHQQFAESFYGAFPDMLHTVDDTVGQEDKVAVRFTLRGTHTGDFMGIPPTGKSITVPAIAHLDIKEGKVTALQAQFDQLGMMMQLGVIPAREE